MKAEMSEKKKELLKKLQALAERGVGGEKETAERKLRELMKKYGIDEINFSEDKLEEFEFKYSNPQEEQLIRQLFFKMFGQDWRSKSYTYRCGKGSKSIRGIECTKAEGVQLQIEYEFYKQLWQEEMKLFWNAFIQKHRIFSMRPEDTKGSDKPLSPEERAEVMRMSMMMDAMQNKTIQPLLEAAD
jgi:hypothetical protein